MQLSIIIVNYSVKYFLEQCLLSVIKACASITAEIIVVDNFSTDGSEDFFTGRFPEVQFLWESKNAGFAKANNKALSLAKGEKILFLNPDTILPENCLSKCLQYLKENGNTGAMGVKMVDGSGIYLPESKRGFPTTLTSFFKISGLARAFPNSSIVARYYMGHIPKDKSAVIDVVAGAFMMIDRKVLDKVGGFDEDYFMYAEDIDLSYRIQKAGYQNVYFVDTTIIHFKGESTAKQSADYIRNFYGAMILFVKKHYSKTAAVFFTLALKMLIQIKILMLSKRSNSIDEQTDLECINFLCSNETFKRISSVMKKNQIVAARISAIDELKSAASVICFCEEAISFTAIINHMQDLAGKHFFLIHADKSRSIIGSTDKNKTGTVINLE